MIVCISVFIVLGFQLKHIIPEKNLASSEVEKVEKVEKEVIQQTKVEDPKQIIVEKVIEKEPALDATKIINDSQSKVYTILTETSQGSGFLINHNGDILTNAHVVEGSLNVSVKNKEGQEYSGEIIGYSNTIDVAVIRVPGLANLDPLQLESQTPAKIGEEVIALGTPQGYENTATLGNISGVNRTFTIEPFTYEGVYQTSAPIAPGSSGGPLLEKKTGKVIAINSARDEREMNIGFSIPLYSIFETVTVWVNNPMSEDEIIAYFYDEAGDYYYQDYYSEYGYFDSGEYSEDYSSYYVIPDDDSAYESYEYEEQYEEEYEYEEQYEEEYEYEEQYEEEYQEENYSEEQEQEDPTSEESFEVDDAQEVTEDVILSEDDASNPTEGTTNEEIIIEDGSLDSEESSSP
ncbi:S1C family serine protease [Metabacillus herbersteinensis]